MYKNCRGGGYDYGISFCRLIAMIFIISCHVLQYFSNEFAWWLNCGVQIFICISGFLYGQREIENGYKFIKQRFIRIIVAYYLCLIIDLSIMVIFSDTPVSLKEIILLFFCKGTIPGLGHMWFVGTILLCYLLTPFLSEFFDEIQKKKYPMFRLFFIIGLLCLLIQVHMPQFNAIWILCYVGGYLLGKYKKFCNKWLHSSVVIFVPLSILLNGARIYLKYVYKVTIGDDLGYLKAVWSCYESISHMFLGISLFLLFYLLYWTLVHNAIPNRSKILQLSDAYSYEIYLTHHMYILGPLSILNLHISNVLKVIVIIIIIIIQSSVIHFVSKCITERCTLGSDPMKKK